MPELAFAFPAAGALAVSVLRGHRGAALAAGGALGLAGLLVAALGAAGAALPGIPSLPILIPSLDLAPSAPGRAVLIVTFVSGALAVVLVPRGADRVPLLACVLVGLAAVAALVALSDPLLLAAVLMVAAALHSALPGTTSFASRVRAPLYGVLLILFGSLAATSGANPTLARLAGLALVLGVTAVIGVAPYLHGLRASEPTPASTIAWLGFLGPALAVVLVTRLAATLPQEAGPGYTAVLLGMGIFNLGIAAVGAWQAAAPVDLWRHSFLADWGLVLVGLGLLNSAAAGGSYLLLVGVLLFRLPLYLLARPALVRAEPPARAGLLTIVLAAALAGGPPFVGFTARLLILRGASQVAWPIALVMVVAMLSWLPLSVKLARTIGRPRGRVLAGSALLLVLNLALGLYPSALLGLFGAR